MPRTNTIHTHDTNVAAIYLAKTGRTPDIFRNSPNSMATFELIGDDMTLAVLASYAAGDLLVNAKQFAQCREFLFRKLKEVR